MTKHITRPMRRVFTELIVLLVAIYMAFVFNILFLCLTAFPLVFQGVDIMSAGVGGLPYLATVTGELLAFLKVVGCFGFLRAASPDISTIFRPR